MNKSQEHFVKWKQSDTETKYDVIPFLWHSGKGKTIKTEIRLMGDSSWEWVVGIDFEAKGTLWGDKIFLYLNCDGD